MTNADKEMLAMQKLIFCAWTDEEFLQRLRANPREAMGEMGLTPIEGVEYRVLEDSANLSTFVIPPPP